MNNELCHYGVKGMKWGVGKKEELPSYKARTKYGENIMITQDRIGLLGNTIQKMTKQERKFHTYTARNSKNKKVGGIQLYRESPDEMNIVFLDTKKKYEGRGYATSVLKTGERIAKEAGAKKITAEVVGNSPNMLHITDTSGYVRKGEIKTQEVLEIWGGLTLVEKRLR